MNPVTLPDLITFQIYFCYQVSTHPDKPLLSWQTKSPIIVEIAIKHLLQHWVSHTFRTTLHATQQLFNCCAVMQIS